MDSYRKALRIKTMIDGHIHIERGPYTLEWIDRFVEQAVRMKLTEIRLLEHNYMFPEFAPMYDNVCSQNGFVRDWFQHKAGFKDLRGYLDLIEKVRGRSYPVTIKFGLEICYFKDSEDFIRDHTQDLGLDFLLGSMHFADSFAFDHNADLWQGVDVDKVFRRYFEDSVFLAESGLFDGIGHPDQIKMFGHKASFPLNDYYESLAAALSKNNMYADQNSGAHRRCPDTAELGMNKELIRALNDHGVPVITSSDAHCPEDVGYKIEEMSRCFSGI